MHHLNHLKSKNPTCELMHLMDKHTLNLSTLQSSTYPIFCWVEGWSIRTIRPPSYTPSFTRPMGIKRPQLQVPSLALTQPASLKNTTPSGWWHICPSEMSTPNFCWQKNIKSPQKIHKLEVIESAQKMEVAKFPWIFSSTKKSLISCADTPRFLENPKTREGQLKRFVCPSTRDSCCNIFQKCCQSISNILTSNHVQFIRLHGN